MALTDNILAYWKLNETSGDAVDEVAGLTLTNVNTATYSPTNAKLGNALNLASASSQRLSHASDATLERGATSYTWSCWYRPISVSAGEEDLISKYSSSADRQYVLLQNNTDVTFTSYISTTNRSVTASAVLSANTYVFIVCGNDAATNKRFISINGAAKTLGSAGVDSAGLGSTGEFNIGAVKDTGSYFNHVNGIIDEIGFWSRMLSDAEIAQLYNGGAGLTYPFLTGGGLLMASY